uniref:hypothetical protein n=1 Tax=Candidatus Roseilinea sp. TaxID=2838777 RepID=UPI0040498169
MDQTRQRAADLFQRIEATLHAISEARESAMKLNPADERNTRVAQAIADLDAANETLRSLQSQICQQQHSAADQDSIKLALEQVATCETTVNRTQQQIALWQTDLLKARDLATQIEIALQEAKTALDGLPAQRGAVQSQRFLDELAARCSLILQQSLVPAVDSLADLCAAGEELLTDLKAATRDWSLLREQHQRTTQMIAAIQHRYRQMQELMQSLSQTSVCPVVWERSEAEMRQIREMLAPIAETPESDDSSGADDRFTAVLSVDARMRELELHIKAVANQHSRLVVALDSPELASRKTWIAQASAIQNAVSGYASNNWPRHDAVLSLKSDIAIMAGIETELEQLYLRQPIHEDQIRLWLDRVNAYIRDRRALQARLDHINEILKALVEAECSARELVSDFLRLLARLPADIPNPNAAASAQWSDIVELWQQGRHIASSLDQPLVGRVTDKVSAARAWAQDCYNSAHRLLHALETELRAAHNQLREEVDRIARLAPLDMEPVMLIAKKLAQTPLRIWSGADLHVGGKTDDLAGATETIVDQIATAVDLYARLSRALSDLDRQIVAPMGNRPNEVLAQRHAAHEQWEALSAIKSQLTDWRPIPITCPDIDEIERVLALAENNWEELSRNGRSVENIISRLDDLIEQYRAIRVQAEQLRTRVEKQMAQLQLAWDRYVLWNRHLRRYREQHLSDRAMSTAINKRLEEMHRSIAHLQRRFAGASISINSAHEEIEQITRAARRDLEVRRDGHIQVVSASVIVSAETQPPVTSQSLQRGRNGSASLSRVMQIESSAQLSRDQQ